MDMIPEVRIAYPVIGAEKEDLQVEDDNKLSYFCLGLGIGVAVGVLFAPKSGAETRNLIRSKAEEGVDYVKKAGEDLRGTATEAIDRGKETIRRHKDNLSAAVEAGKQAYRESLNNPAPE